MQSDSLAAIIDLSFYLSMLPFWSKFHLISPACQKGTGKKSHWTVCDPVCAWSFSIQSFAEYSHQQKLLRGGNTYFQMVNQFAVIFAVFLTSRAPQELFSL